MNRVRHHLQQGARLAWNDSLFETVPQAPQRVPVVEPVPAGEARELTWEEAEGPDEALWRSVL